MERENQAMGHILIVVAGEMEEEVPLSSFRSLEVDLVALPSATFLELGVERFAASSAATGASLAKDEADNQHAKGKKSD